MSYGVWVKNKHIGEALEALNVAYEKERSGRAKQAWGHGVMWALMKLQDGQSLESVIAQARELNVDI